MNIGGFQQTSLLDYPDTISAIIWTTGCNFFCPFCYNPQLVKGEVPLIAEAEIFSFLQKRKGKLEALVISGGEPLLQPDIRTFTTKVKDLGYLVKIDTNGTRPDALKDLIDHQCVDYLAMDIKAPPQKYHLLTGTTVDLDAIKRSIELLKTSGIAYELKTTVVPTLLDKQDIIAIAQWIQGSTTYYLQQFKPDTTLLSPDLEQQQPYPAEYLKEIKDEIAQYVDKCQIRGVS